MQFISKVGRILNQLQRKLLKILRKVKENKKETYGFKSQTHS